MTIPEKPVPVKLLGPEDAAAYLKVSGKQVRNLCAAGHIGQKVNGTWVIQEPELIWFAEYGRRRPGRPLNLAGESHGPKVED